MKTTKETKEIFRKWNKQQMIFVIILRALWISRTVFPIPGFRD